MADLPERSEWKVIACEMVENELRCAMEHTGGQLDAIWLERGLHNSPERLRVRLQEEIDKLPQTATAVLAFAQCGNAAVGLRCTCAKLVIPRFADCIRIVLSLQPGQYNEADPATLYTGKGWLESDRSLKAEYEESLRRYGPERTQKIYRIMLKHYRSVALMDTGAYRTEEYEEQARSLAERLELQYTRCDASLRIYEKLFRGEWDEEFVVLRQGETVEDTHFFCLCGEVK